MVAWFKAQWAQLPHQLQAVLLAFGSGVLTMAAANVMQGKMCTTWACIQGRIPEYMAAGASAAFAFYRKPNTGEPK